LHCSFLDNDKRTLGFNNMSRRPHKLISAQVREYNVLNSVYVMKGNGEKASKQLLAPNQLLCKDKFPSNTLCVIKQDNE